VGFAGIASGWAEFLPLSLIETRGNIRPVVEIATDDEAGSGAFDSVSRWSDLPMQDGDATI
jgi:hypothetical protein